MSKQNKRESFIFYRSFYESLKEVDDATQLKVYKAISEYALNHKEVKLEGMSSVIFKLVKPQLDANWRRYENGCKGGCPEGSHNNPNGRRGTNQELTKNLPNDNVNENLNLNYNKNKKDKENYNPNHNEEVQAQLQAYYSSIHPVQRDINDDLPWG